MSVALAPAFIVASLLLWVSGAMKGRSPRSPRAPMRALAVGEMALGVACLLWPQRSLALALAAVYALFAGVAVILMRRRAACGCFGENDFPVTAGHVIASALLGTLVLASAVAGPRGLGWVFGLPAPQAAVLLAGIIGAVYAVVLVYTVVPRAWGAWERA